MWAATVIAGALLIRFWLAEVPLALIQVPLHSEPFHVLAHCTIYGGLAWMLRGAGWARAIGATMLAALCQEGAQVFGKRTFGPEELFDLGVDLAAAVAVLTAARWRAGRVAERLAERRGEG